LVGAVAFAKATELKTELTARAASTASTTTRFRMVPVIRAEGSDMCLQCIQIVEAVLAQRMAGGAIEGVRIGEPMSRRERFRWVRENLPLTAAMMDLDGWIASAEREPALTGR
jgi:hypothetical protein